MNKILFNKNILIKELKLPDKAIEHTLIIKTESYDVYQIIFKYKEEYYRTWYMAHGNEKPWKEQDQIECYKVEKVNFIKDLWGWRNIL